MIPYQIDGNAEERKKKVLSVVSSRHAIAIYESDIADKYALRKCNHSRLQCEEGCRGRPHLQ